MLNCVWLGCLFQSEDEDDNTCFLLSEEDMDALKHLETRSSNLLLNKERSGGLRVDTPRWSCGIVIQKKKYKFSSHMRSINTIWELTNGE